MEIVGYFRSKFCRFGPDGIPQIIEDNIPLAKNKLFSDLWSIRSACANNVDERYILKTLKMCLINSSVRGVFVLYDNGPKAFIITEDKFHGASHSLHLDIICGYTGYGSKILQPFLNFADSIGSNVDLHSLATVLLYYPKFGFQFRSSCESDAIEIPQSIRERMIQEIREGKGPRDNDEAYDNPVWADALEYLTAFDLNVEKQGPCKNASKAQIKAHNCGVNGYEMFRCTYPTSMGPEKPASKTTRLKPTDQLLYDSLTAVPVTRTLRSRT